MAQLARGSVTDRPWGMTLGALGMRGLSGQLTVVTDGKPFRVAFDQGAVVGAHSPLASDSAVRLALTGNLVTSTQVPEITRRLAAAPNRDEVDMLAEIARLSPDQAQRLRRRLVAQRAARTFSLDRGDFVVEDEITIAIVPGSELDIRAIVYLGAKSNLSEERLGNELAMLGGWFKLKQAAVADLVQYGFTEAEKPALRMLVEGANLADIEANNPDLGARGVRAVTYALASCGACELGPPQPPRAHSISTAPTFRSGVSDSADTQPRQTAMRPPGQSAPAMRPQGQTASTLRPLAGPSGSSGVPSAIHNQPGSAGVSAGVPRPTVNQPGSAGVPRPMVNQPGSAGVPRPMSSPGSSGATRAKTPSAPPPGTEGLVRMKTPTGMPPTQTLPTPEQPAPAARAPGAGPTPRRAKRNTAATMEIDLLLRNKIPLLDGGADYYALLGLPQTASADEIRNTYFMLARKLHPDRLSAIGVVDEARNAQRLMAQINAAFGVLNDPTKRAEYTSVLARGGEAAIRAEEAKADEMAMRVMRAEEVFRQGEMALRRDQLASALDCFKQAVELQPQESEYQALYAWTQFAVAPDKNVVAAATRKALTKAAEQNERSPTARFYLGRVERMLGKEREALAHFQEVLRIKPNHAEASSEARVLEQRLKGKR